jgi:hypothetical protein
VLGKPIIQEPEPARGHHLYSLVTAEPQASGYYIAMLLRKEIILFFVFVLLDGF